MPYFLISAGYLNFDESKGYRCCFLSHHVCALQMSPRHLRLDGDTKLLLALSHFLDCPSRVRLLGVLELPGHANV